LGVSFGAVIWQRICHKNFGITEEDDCCWGNLPDSILNENEPELFRPGDLIDHGKQKNGNYDYDDKRTAAYDKCDNSPEPEVSGATFEL
jgi:hypothetical protein